MYTSFHDNQNLPEAGNKQEIFSRFQHLKTRLQAKEALTCFLQDNLAEVVWLAEVNGAIFNLNRCCSEYSGNLAVKTLILEFIKGLPRSKHIFLLPYATTAQKKRQASQVKALFSQQLVLLEQAH